MRIKLVMQYYKFLCMIQGKKLEWKKKILYGVENAIDNKIDFPLWLGIVERKKVHNEV